MASGDYQLDGEFSPSNGTLTSLGKTNGESFYGLRVYPGNYFFEQITMQSSDRLRLRTFNDSDQPSQPANPNSGQSSNRNVRFWIGKRQSGNDYNSSFNYQTTVPVISYLNNQPAIRFDYQPITALRATFKYAGERQRKQTFPGSLPGFNDTRMHDPVGHLRPAPAGGDAGRVA